MNQPTDAETTLRGAGISPGADDVASDDPPTVREATLPIDLAPDSLVGGAYRVVRPLGGGAMGLVVLAYDVHLQREVAIKVLHPDGEGERETLLAEARAMARVRHPNVVEIYAIGEMAGTPYLVMEYVPSLTLDQWALARGGFPLAIDEALAVLRQVATGLDAIHAARTAHRDLKPANILVGEDGRVKIVDLGLARLVDRDHAARGFHVSGTPAYIAPEVASLRDVPAALMPKTDIYSLGVIAFQLLTGRVPFQSRTLGELLVQHASVPPPPARSLNPALPPALDDALAAALAKDPEARPESATAFVESLAAAASTRGADRSGTPVRVLVADDDDSLRAFVGHVLRRHLPNAEIELVRDGAAAVAAAAVASPSLALLDIDMPGLDGFETLRTLRARGGPWRVPVVMMTGEGTPSDWRQLQELGADAFLVKPFSITQLASIVDALLARPLVKP